MDSWHRSDWFSFFQAVGSVVAIIAAGAIAAYQGYSTKKQMKEQKKASDASTLSALTKVFEYALLAYAHMDFYRNEDSLDAYSDLIDSDLIRSLTENLANFPIHQLPDTESARMLIHVRITLEQLRGQLKRVRSDAQYWKLHKDELFDAYVDGPMAALQQYLSRVSTGTPDSRQIHLEHRNPG